MNLQPIPKQPDHIVTVFQPQDDNGYSSHVHLGEETEAINQLDASGGCFAQRADALGLSFESRFGVAMCRS